MSSLNSQDEPEVRSHSESISSCEGGPSSTASPLQERSSQRERLKSKGFLLGGLLLRNLN